MDKKLQEFVALLHRPAPRAAGKAASRPQKGKPVPPHWRALRWPRLTVPSLTLPKLRLPGGPTLWANITSGVAVVGVLSAAVWLALPAPRFAPSITVPPPSTLTRLSMPMPQASTMDTAPDEKGEMTAADPPIASRPPPEPPPAVKVATLTPSALPPVWHGEPAWVHFAVPAPVTQGRARIAIVIDDLGPDRKRTERAIGLKGPLTLSFLAYATDLPRLTDEAHRAGHELMVHVPMEPISRTEDMGPNGLTISLGRDEVLRRLRWDLGRFDGYVGINNHMGSRFTSDANGMMPVMEELKARGLLFLDSRTIGNSIGAELAHRLGVPSASRDVFLDDDINGPAVAAQLAELETIAKRHGTAIAIGHPHDVTLDQLASWIANLSAKGLTLVPVSAVVKERARGGGAAG